MGLKPIRKTKTGYSTDEDTLTQLAAQHELPAQIVNYRGLSKLKSTYVDALPELVNPETKRLHTSLNQTVITRSWFFFFFFIILLGSVVCFLTMPMLAQTFAEVVLPQYIIRSPPRICAGVEQGTHFGL